MNKQDLNKIAVALIEKYGTETGVELLTQLIQEMNKPAETQIVNTQTPYYTTPYTTPYIPPNAIQGSSDSIEIDWSRTLNSAR